MNYRHAYHAGNFADVMKHAVLTRILAHLLKKETAFRVIDTHAGIGLYDLDAEEAGKTLEWQGGIGRMAAPFGAEVEALLVPYRRVLEETRARHGGSAYPGSPLIARTMLRPQDRAIFVEKHPQDAETLAALFARDGRAKVLALDGWTALNAMIPPKERRGLVLIDPPFEEPDELRRLGEALRKAQRKWPTGTFVAWYPIKDAREIAAFAGAIASAGPPKSLRLELMVTDGRDPARLNGAGLIVVNPPWTLAAEADILLPALAERLAQGERAGFRADWLSGEAAIP